MPLLGNPATSYSSTGHKAKSGVPGADYYRIRQHSQVDTVYLRMFTISSSLVAGYCKIKADFSLEIGIQA
jgi:hypothetical protein